jgi:hypothetical protein
VAGRTYVRGADLLPDGGGGRQDGTSDLAAAVASSAVAQPATLPR